MLTSEPLPLVGARPSFDSAASGYDAVAESDLGVVLRGRVHDRLAPFVGEGTRVLDLGCGTGLDARWAANRGADVVAVDGSPEMVRLASRRLGSCAEVSVQDLNDRTWRLPVSDEHRFDVIVANFGVVSCVSDMAAFGRQLSSLVADGGRAVLVPMAKIVPWEQVPAAARLNLSLARRRFGDRVAASHDPSLSIRYYSAASLVAALGGQWQAESAEALGWALPTYERRNVVQNRPWLRRRLAGLDRFGSAALGRLGVGDHQIVVLSGSD